MHVERHEVQNITHAVFCALLFFLTSILNMRAPGMSMARMPINQVYAAEGVT